MTLQLWQMSRSPVYADEMMCLSHGPIVGEERGPNETRNNKSLEYQLTSAINTFIVISSDHLKLLRSCCVYQESIHQELIRRFESSIQIIHLFIKQQL